MNGDAAGYIGSIPQHYGSECGVAYPGADNAGRVLARRRITMHKKADGKTWSRWSTLSG